MRLWVVALAGLAALRAAIPLAALAASGEQLPGLPRYRFVALTGDATGFYAAAREFMAAWGRLPVALVAVLAVATIAGAVLLVRDWRRNQRRRPWLAVAASAWVSLLAALAILEMNPAGAAVVGWPLVWALPMLPYRALGLPLDPEVAFAFGLVLSLAANAIAVVATAYAGFYATGRRGLGLLAAALLAFWPLLVGVVGGSRAWGNGTWSVDAGLHLYTEPLSTALVAVALAFLLRPGMLPLPLVLAGSALGLATAVKLSNGIVAALGAAILLKAAGLRSTLPYLAGGLAWAPVVIAFWPLGYPTFENLPDPLWTLDRIGSSWTDSLLWTPRTLALVLPLAAVGALGLPRDRRLALLLVWTLTNAVVYPAYYYTAQHPRFMFSSLPSLFVLTAAGVSVLAGLRAHSGQLDRLGPGIADGRTGRARTP